MKKILLVAASILFAGGLYVNFAMEPSVEPADPVDEIEVPEETAGDEPKEQEEAPDDDGDEAAEDGEVTVDEPEPEVAFNQENLNETYKTVVQNNEPLIIDVLLPDYYSEDFIERLEDEFGTGTIEFNRLELNANTTELSELDVNENSDAVIIDALQVQDYNDEVLHEREQEALGVAYRNIYDNDKVVFILGNANVHQHENLEGVLEEDEDYFTGNDYYYIDNQDVEASDYYNEDVMTPEVENEVTRNIYDFLISES